MAAEPEPTVQPWADPWLPQFPPCDWDADEELRGLIWKGVRGAKKFCCFMLDSMAPLPPSPPLVWIAHVGARAGIVDNKMQSSTSTAPVWCLCSVNGSVPNTLHNPQSKIAPSQSLPGGSRALGYPGAPIQEPKYRGPGSTLPMAPSTWHCKAWPRPCRRVRPREAEAGIPGAVSPGHAHLPAVASLPPSSALRPPVTLLLHLRLPRPGVGDSGSLLWRPRGPTDSSSPAQGPGSPTLMSLP